jgi:hypothetical protein
VDAVSAIPIPIMDPNSQAFLMIPVPGRIQPESEVRNDPPKQSYSSFFPSFLPTWGSMRTGIPPIRESPSSSSISEVPSEPDMSDDEMSVAKPLARSISEVPSEPDMSDDEMSVAKPLARRVCNIFYSECQELNSGPSRSQV